MAAVSASQRLVTWSLVEKVVSTVARSRPIRSTPRSPSSTMSSSRRHQRRLLGGSALVRVISTGPFMAAAAEEEWEEGWGMGFGAWLGAKELVVDRHDQCPPWKPAEASLGEEPIL
ncbi:hypothetical protein U9M48_018725 [Paspalum notatum var. saurae]|uniref:Uncharacterized protein n=1 Tax=Paspalum notatum var. saurae TaxID=547442 RepID=A0AAQ3TA06_PASNO